MNGLRTDAVGELTTRLTAVATAPAGAQAVAADVVQRYGEAARAYHTLEHIGEMLRAVRRLTDPANPADPADPADRTIAELATWLHDVVYDPAAGPGANEEASALYAAEVLQSLGAPQECVEDVATIVRATATHEPPEEGRPRLRAHLHVVLDADLWILAAPSPRFAAYCAQVRREHCAVPEEVYRPARRAVLEALRDRPRLYLTPAAAAWERLARANLTREIDRLG